MRVWKLICSIAVIAFGIINLTGLLPSDTVLPFMFAFLGLALFIAAKERYDKGSKGDAILIGGAAVFVWGVTVYNVFTRIFWK